MYEIVLRGRLPIGWEQWFDRFTASVSSTPDGPVTTLTGPVRDQAALHGALARIRDLALPVISVTLVPADDTLSAGHAPSPGHGLSPGITSRATPSDT